MPPEDAWRGCLLLVGLVWLGRWLWQRRLAWAVGDTWRSWRRSLRPRTPHDCPSCRAMLATPVPPAGFACPNPACPDVGSAPIKQLVHPRPGSVSRLGNGETKIDRRLVGGGTNRPGLAGRLALVLRPVVSGEAAGDG